MSPKMNELPTMDDVTVYPWLLGGISLSRAVMDRVSEEARKAYQNDEESCGLLAGPAAQPLVVDTVVPMENRANKLHKFDPETYPRTGRMYFDIDPMKFDREMKARATAGTPAKILYHSHLDVGSYFSETDAQAATMGGDAPAYPLAYLVTSVRGPKEAGGAPFVDEAKLFIWDAASKKFAESKLTIVGDSVGEPE
ncbi:MAG: Mov34/MPN/PAD-1 family protein [Polyangiaceae bacterium]